MRRLTARILFVVTLLGSFIPVALATASSPVQACCARKGIHHCQGSANRTLVGSEPSGLTVRDACDSNQNGGRAVTTVRWAHAQPTAAFSVAFDARGRHEGFDLDSLLATDLHSRSSRAPPAF